MSAIQQLKQQTTAVNQAPVDFEQRFELAKAFRKTGIFADVRVKMDTRRNSLSIILVRNTRFIGTDNSDLIKFAAKAGLTVQLRMTSGSSYERIFRIETLYANTTTGKSTPAPATTKVDPKVNLATALANANANVVVIGGSVVGSVSASLANHIRKLVIDENKPKVKTINMIDLSQNKPVDLTLPANVADAVTQLVPSYSEGDWSLKTTCNISILTQVSTNKKWVMAK